MPSAEPTVLPNVAPPEHAWEDYRQIFVDELLTHRQSLQRSLQEWIQEQDGILERALARACATSVHEQKEAAHPLFCTLPMRDGVVADKAGNLATCTSQDLEAVVISRQESPASKAESCCSPMMGDQHGTISGSAGLQADAHSQAAVIGFRRSKTRKRTNLIYKTRIMRKLALFVHSRHFEILSAVVILANAVLLGAASDYAMANLSNPEHHIMTAVELGFCSFYFLEVCLRMAVYGRRYFRSADWRWNWFDLTLVIMSIWDQIETRLLPSGGALENLSFLRLLRLMKMLKLLRMIRLMRMFRELRLILYSVLGCVQAMFWATVLIATTSYMFGICFLQACTQYLQSHDQADLNADVVSDINEYWSSVGTVMLSLYMTATAGKEWSAVARPLKTVGWLFYFLFLLYIAFFAFVVMNTVTSLFLEATISNADKDQHAIIQEELEKKDRYIIKLQEFYDQIDEDGDGHISYEEFCNHYNTPDMRAFATSLDIDVLDAKEFFGLLSDYGQRPVDVETFVVGCIKFKGAARSMDLMDLMYAHKDAQTHAKDSTERQMERLDTLEKLMIQNLAMARRSIERDLCSL